MLRGVSLPRFLLRSKNGRIAAVFLCSISLGIWTGAAWHASVHELQEFREHLGAVQERSAAPNELRIQASDDCGCATCQLSLVAPEIPSPAVLPELALVERKPTPDVELVSFKSADWTLPLGCGPPV